MRTLLIEYIPRLDLAHGESRTSVHVAILLLDTRMTSGASATRLAHAGFAW